MRFTTGPLLSRLQSERVQTGLFLLVGLTAVATLWLARAAAVPQSLQTLGVDGLQIATNLFALLCCLYAAFGRRGVARPFWLLFGGSIAVQLCADVGWALVHCFGIHVAAPDVFPSLFYRLYAGPMAIALFLSGENQISRFRSFLDGCIVVGLVGLTVYQVQITEMNANNPRFWQTITVTTAVNALLALIAVVRYFLCTPGTLRSLFLRQVLYLWAYVGVCTVTAIADAYYPRLSPYADLLWSLSYLVAAALAITWRPPPTLNHAPTSRISRRTSLLCFNLTLATMVLASALLGLRLLNPTQLVGLTGVGVVLFSFAVRSALMQDGQEKILVDLQESRAALRRQALFDELTGLPNRRLLIDRLEQALAGAKREGTTVAVLYLDLDGFKPINDQFGHAVGDGVLVETAQRLRSTIRDSDTVARMGGDEFTMLLNPVTEEEDAGRLASLIVRILSEPMTIKGKAVFVTVSIGIAVFPDDAGDCETIIHHADLAMYAAKRGGSNCVQFFTAPLHPANSNELCEPASSPAEPVPSTL